MPRVLVVEGREDARVADVLLAEGFDVNVAPPVAEVVAKAVTAHEPEAVVLEIVRVNRSVNVLCNAVMGVTGAPIAIFSGRGHEREIVDGFETGAQAVFTEPIGAHELVARVRAVLRRYPTVVHGPDEVIVVGPVVLDRNRRQLTVDGQPVQVPRKEFEIAEILMRHAGRVVPRRDLVRELWGAPRDTKSLDVQVGRLRARISAVEGHQRIVTVRGVGYRFATDEDLDLVPEPGSSPAR